MCPGTPIILFNFSKSSLFVGITFSDMNHFGRIISNASCNNSLVLKDIMEPEVDEKYFYKKDYEIISMNKKVCASLKVNTTEI